MKKDKKRKSTYFKLLNINQTKNRRAWRIHSLIFTHLKSDLDLDLVPDKI